MTSKLLESSAKKKNEEEKQMKKIMQTMLAIAVVFMCVSGADAGQSFNLIGVGNANCLGTQLTLGGTTYTVHRNQTITCVGGNTNTANNPSTIVKLVFVGGYSNCGGGISEVCSKSVTLSGSATSTTKICNIDQWNMVRSLTYTISQSSSTCNGLSSWDITFTADDNTPYSPP
jgi:hypothetical protein